MSTEPIYEGLYEATGGGKGWFVISKLVFDCFMCGHRGLCQSVRVNGMVQG
jgi:hypothetical protein